ncbi:MAG: hypothetical protein Q9194_001364, partial [Teloschistes cf. exilis]
GKTAVVVFVVQEEQVDEKAVSGWGELSGGVDWYIEFRGKEAGLKGETVGVVECSKDQPNGFMATFLGKEFVQQDKTGLGDALVGNRILQHLILNHLLGGGFDVLIGLIGAEDDWNVDTQGPEMRQPEERDSFIAVMVRVDKEDDIGLPYLLIEVRALMWPRRGIDYGCGDILWCPNGRWYCNLRKRRLDFGCNEYIFDKRSILLTRVAPAPPLPPPSVHISNVPASMATIAPDTSNTLGHPSGPEYQLAVGEGIYALQDDLHLATPPPHPSEHTSANPNPLATAPPPPTTGVKISVSRINPRKPPQLYKIANTNSTRSNLATYSIKESEKESRSSHDTSSDGLAPHSANVAGKTPVFGEDNALLTPATSKDGVKRKKPKTNIVKSNSSWISRVMPHEAMTKRIQEHNPEGLLAFANINRAFQWLDLSSSNDTKAQHVIKILFTKAHILCHDINLFTKGPNHLELVLGASTGDIMWFEAFSQKYARINKNAMINPSSIHQVRWLPGSENLFLAAHMDGTLIVYDKERDDAAFVPEESSPLKNFTHGLDTDHRPLHVTKSVNSRNQKSNPVASWKISNHRINDFAFAPDHRHLAVVTEDGYLHIIDYLNEQLSDIYPSYYGAFLCVCWSPDGKYILTGGQDDLVSIWSLDERRLVARCPGHHSWVSCVAFDPWRCDDRNYRFGSVGEDRRLLLWDFNVGMLHRPKAVGPPSPLQSELPPVMSKIIDEDPMSWLGFEEDNIITACANGHIRLWSRPDEATE